MESEILKIVESLSNGGVVLMPTDTVYGLMCLPTHPEASKNIFHLKSRPENMNLQILISSNQDLLDLGLDINNTAEKLLNSPYMPGALTLILGFSSDYRPERLAGREEVAVRMPNHTELLKVIQKTGPVLATSANKSGNPTLPTTKEILNDLIGTPDLVIDGGSIPTVPSTIVNCRSNPYVIQRVGVVSETEIHTILGNLDRY